MKKVSLLLFGIFTLIALSAFTEFNTEKSSSGAPSGEANDPASGNANCTDCHSPSLVTPMSGWITSTIPLGGYVPGTTYTITATMTRPGHTKFGFEVSPQNPSGTFLGTLVNTGTLTKLTGTNHYVTHTSAGNTGTSPKSWTFNWTAPVKGSGSVTFYGAFLATNANNSTSGDSTFTSTLVVAENTATDVNDMNALNSAVAVFPNPTSDKINLNYTLNLDQKFEVSLINIEGKQIEILFSGNKLSGVYNEQYSIPSSYSKGIYFLKLTAGENVVVKRILVQ